MANNNPPIKIGRTALGEKEPVSLRRQGAVLRRLWKYLRRFRFTLFTALVMTVVSNVLALVGPKLSGKAIDAIGDAVGGVNFPRVWYYCALMLVFYLLSALFSYLLNYIMIRLGKQVAQNMRKDVFDHLLTLPVGFFDKYQAGDIISRISYDIDTINASLSTDFVQILASTITVVGSFVMMISISPILVLVFAVTLPATALFTKFRTTRVRPLFRRRSEKLGELNGYVEEILSGQTTVKAYGKEDEMSGHFDERNDEAVDAYYKAEFFSTSCGPIVGMINNIALTMISVLGALLYLFSRISLGQISSFVLYSRRFSGPINEFANILSELQSATTAAERVFRLLDEPGEPADVENAIEMRHEVGRVDMQNVCFGYRPEHTILHDLTFTAKPGQVVAIVGPTGAGKTTIINLLMRFYDVQGGKILLDGIPIEQITRSSLRAAYTMVLQDTWLFGGTVRENIAYGRLDATDDEIVAAAKAAHIHSFIERLPQGYDTVINEDGLNISKGQKQLLTIARAMLSKAPMLILDEATSNVDSRTEIIIQSAMRKLMENKTCFVIAHRLSTIQNADVILVLRDGDIVEQGTHTELMQKGGFYRTIYDAQFD